MNNAQPQQSVEQELDPQTPLDPTPSSPPSLEPDPEEENQPKIFEQKLFFGENQPDISAEEKIRRENLKNAWQVSFEKVTKGLGNRGIFDPEVARVITNSLIQEVHLSYELYKGDPEDPVACVDQDLTGKVIIAPELIEGLKKPDMTVEQCDLDYVINHELGHLLLHNSFLYPSSTIKNFLNLAESIPERQQKGEAIDTSNFPPEIAYILNTLQEAVVNPEVLKGETKYIQGLGENLSDEKDEDGKTKLQKQFEKYLKIANNLFWSAFGVPDKKGKSFEELDEDAKAKALEFYKKHMLKQVAEEMLNERLTSYITSNGTEEGYWKQFLARIKTGGEDSLEMCLLAKGVDQSIIGQAKAIIDSQDIEETEKYAKFQELMTQDTTGKMAEYLTAHSNFFQRFKKLSEISPEQLKNLDNNDLLFDDGMPYYEQADLAGIGSWGGAGAKEGWTDTVWRVVFGVK